MADGGVPKDQVGSPSSAAASSPSDLPKDKEEDEGDLWIHWEDDYWAGKDDDLQPVPDTAHHNNSLPGSGGVGVGGNATTDNEALLEADRDLAISLLPVLVMLAVVLLLTILGNALVCLVYRTRFRRNTASLFVVFLAALETVIMCVGVPLETAVLALPLTFHSPTACKLARYVETSSICAVLLTLVAVAADRYCKLTRPTNFQMQKWAKGLCAAAVMLALCLGVPAFFVFGSRSVPTRLAGGVKGMTCGVDDAVSPSSPARIVYIVLLLATFFLAILTMTVLYVLMFVRICRRKSASRKEKVSPAKYPRKHRFVTEDSTSSCGGGGEETRRLPTSSSGSGSSGLGVSGPAPRSGRTSPGVDPAKVPLKSGVKESARIGQGASTTVDVQSTRMTFIFFLVSLTAVLSIMVVLLVHSLYVLTPLLDDVQPVAVVVVLQVCVRLFLLHPPLVPIIYLLCNHNFRREAKHLLQKVGLSCKRQPSSPSSTSSSSKRNSHR